MSVNRIRLEEHPTKVKILPHQERGLMYTSTGYGSKIPTSLMIKYANRWRRIYCRIFSNIGTNYILVNKQEIIVD